MNLTTFELRARELVNQMTHLFESYRHAEALCSSHWTGTSTRLL